MAYPVENTCL